MAPNPNVITEITPLRKEDFFYLVDRYKTQFDYPLHQHREIELNFVENCDGARRIVGDSVVELGKYDLVMVGSNLAHVWEQYHCKDHKIREITIQFHPDTFGEAFLNKSLLRNVAQLLDRAKLGIAFGQSAIMRCYSQIVQLTEAQPDFYRILKFLELLNTLAEETDYTTLASSSFASLEESSDSRRIRKVEEYVAKHFDEEIRLEKMAELAFMSPTAFSRFFKLHTGRTLSEYIIETRLGNASRLLAGSNLPVQEICFKCGFNNISNFNRIFKRCRGCTPSEFRELYRKTRVVV